MGLTPLSPANALCKGILGITLKKLKDLNMKNN
jgi:hypothetical protein